MPSGSSRDNTIYKSQMVLAYKSDRVTYIGPVPDAPYLSGFSEILNGATTSLMFVLPRKIDAFGGANMPNSLGTIVLGNVLKWVLFGPGLATSGLVRYVGVIDTIHPILAEDGGESVEITVTPLSAILADHAVVGPISYGTPGSAGTYVDTGTIFSGLLGTTDAITSQPYLSPFTLDGTNPATTGQTVQATFQNQSLLSAMTTILLLSPANYFFRMNEAAMTASFNQYSLTTATYTLKLGQHVSKMDYLLDNVPRKNMILVQGKGVSAKAVGSSVSTIGERTYFKADNRITDANTAQVLANGLLAFYDRQQVRTKITVPDYRGSATPGLGYDIEQFKVGQTVLLLDERAPTLSTKNISPPWGSLKWGTSAWGGTPTSLGIWGLFTYGQTQWGYTVGQIFNQIVPIVAINYAFHSVELELGWRQPSMNRALYALESKYSDSSMVS